MSTPPNSIAWPKLDCDSVFLFAAGVWLIGMLASGAIFVNPGLMYVSLVMFILTAIFGRAVTHWGFGEGALVIRGVRAVAGEVAALLWFVGTLLGVLGSWSVMLILNPDDQTAGRASVLFTLLTSAACVGALALLLGSFWAVKVAAGRGDL
jgi:hypothetical protein